MKPIGWRFLREAAANPAGFSSSDNVQKALALWWLLVLPLVVVSFAAACSSPPQVAQPVIAASRLDRNTVTRSVSATVLITMDSQQDVDEISEIVITPDPIVLDRDDAVQLSAQAFGKSGQPLNDVDFIWTVVDPLVGMVSRDGRFRASLSAGLYPNAISVTGIQNSASGTRFASATASVTVVGEAEVQELVSVAIIPDHLTVLDRQIYRLRAVGFDENGLVIPGVSFGWQVNRSDLGRVNEIGYLTVEGESGTYEDSITVTGRWEGRSASATTDVTVINAPEADDFLNVQILPQRFHLDTGSRLQLHAVALNGLGEVVDEAVIRWSMADPDAGTVDGTGAFIAGNTPGIYTEAVQVEAIVPGQNGVLRAEDFASVVIRNDAQIRRLERLRVYPSSFTIAPGGRTLLVVEPVDDQEKPARNVSISWEILAKEVGEIDEYGSFTASSHPGRYSEAIQVIAEQQLSDDVVVRKTRTVDVIITGTLAELEVRPPLVTVSPGRTIHFSVIGRDENGVELPGLVTRWRLADESIGIIDPSGNFTAGDNPGIYTGSIIADVTQVLP